jgi:multisubunit Na+/H+ antiporter MnhF subunit
MWFWAVLGLLACQVPLLWATVRSQPMAGVVAVEQAGVVTVLVLLLLAEGLQRPSFVDLSLALALLLLGGGLVFARFMERWLSGDVTDYVTWVAAGAALYGVVLAVLVTRGG